MENLSVRQRAKKAGIPLWRVAVAIGVSEPTLTRWLRFPLPAEKENRVIEAISRLEREIS
nr:MAG TPA: DNA-binding transcriptional regulator [Caudoviricetes sp.]